MKVINNTFTDNKDLPPQIYISGSKNIYVYTYTVIHTQEGRRIA